MRIMSRSMTTAAVMYAFASSSAHAQQAAHPNFSGTWVLDSSKSSNSSAMQDNIPQFSSATWIVAQHGDTLVVDRDMTAAGTDMKSHIVVAADGNAWKNTVAMAANGDVETSTVVSWDKDVLVIRSSGNVMGLDFVQTDRWTLDPAGKVLVSHRSVTVADQGEVQSSILTFTKKD
ncbi:MAG: hypothetical protein ACREK8_12085 [Gemmatimonadales bacterium]